MKKLKLLAPIIGATSLVGMVLPIASCGNVPAPKDFATDSWETVIKVCKKGYKAFAEAYCDANPKDDESAIQIIKDWIKDEEYIRDEKKLRTINISHGSYSAEARVRLISVDYDELYESKKHEKAKFTFEFEDIIDVCAYDVTKDNTWYEAPSEGKPLKSCFLRTYLNDYIFYMLPKAVRKAIKKVNKLSYDFIYENEEPVDTKEIHSPEYLFPLSATEMANLPQEFQEYGFDSNPYDYYSDVEYVWRSGEEYYYTNSEKHNKYYFGTKYTYGYWIRTPGWASEDLGSTVCPDRLESYESKFYAEMPVDVGYGVSPCFCI